MLTGSHVDSDGDDDEDYVNSEFILAEAARLRQEKQSSAQQGQVACRCGYVDMSDSATLTCVMFRRAIFIVSLNVYMHTYIHTYI